MNMIVNKNSRYFTRNLTGVCKKSDKLKSPGKEIKKALTLRSACNPMGSTCTSLEPICPTCESTLPLMCATTRRCHHQTVSYAWGRPSHEGFTPLVGKVWPGVNTLFSQERLNLPSLTIRFKFCWRQWDSSLLGLPTLDPPLGLLWWHFSKWLII